MTSDFRTNFQAYSGHYRLGWLRGAIEAYLRHFHNRTDCTMVPTEALRAELQAAGFERTVVVARGVDTQLFDPLRRSEALRRQWGAAESDGVVLYVGRLAAEKNLEVLLQAFASMRRTDPRLRLVLVGDGPLRESLRQRCPEAVLAGQRSGIDLAAHYASADLFLFPSLTETFGNVTPEAMASGLPVLAFDHAAAGQLIEHGENGWLVPHGDSSAFVKFALNLSCDKTSLHRAGQAALTRTGTGWGDICARSRASSSRPDCPRRPGLGAIAAGSLGTNLGSNQTAVALSDHHGGRARPAGRFRSGQLVRRGCSGSCARWDFRRGAGY